MTDLSDEPAAPDDPSVGEVPLPAAAAPAAAPITRTWAERAWRRAIRRPHRWLTTPWPDDRIIRTATTTAALVVTTFIMMSVVHFNPLDALFGWGRRDAIFTNTTPTGGDMGAHVWGPAYLRDTLLPSLRVNGWSMDWYSGFPAYRFYMVVPALAIVALDTVFAYGVAFKLVVISGLVTMPFCCWAFGRLARFRYPMPELFAFAGLCFALNESYEIYGGNVLSTMAGEFSFSIAISLMLLGLGFLCRALDTGRGAVWAAAFLALACVAHGIVLIYAMVTAALIVVCRSGADLWRVFKAAVDDAEFAPLRPKVYALLLAPAPLALTVLLAQFASAFYVLTALGCIVAVGLVVMVSVQIGPRLVENRRFYRRFALAAVIGVLTLAFAAFWVGPFLFNHQYMTDMKYAPYPDHAPAGTTYWSMLFDQHPPLNFLISGLAIFGFAVSIIRRHVFGTALGLAMIAAGAVVYLAHDSLPIIGLLWNPRVLPWLYLMRYLVMMVGAVELGGLLINLVRNRRAREPVGAGAGSLIALAASLVVLVIFGWVYQVLPLGNQHVLADGAREYSWGPARAPTTWNNWDRARGWTQYNFAGYEGQEMYPEYHDVVQTMAEIGESEGCGRALWQRGPASAEEGAADVNSPYGTSMALMLLPHWTDGCIQSSEGLFFEASGTTPYHFVTADAMSSHAYSPVRQMREHINNAEVGVPYLQQLGIQYLMVTSPPAVREADRHDDLTSLATSGKWHIYEVADSDIVVGLDAQPVVVRGRSGDQRECWLEVGMSWFQQPWEWAAVPAEDGPAEWQRVDAAIDPDRQFPSGQGLEGCGDPLSDHSRQVNIVQPAQPIEQVPLPEVEVTNVEIEDQSLSFDVDQVGVPVLVKVSYFPNWQASGADGPYRIAPNYMVVVPIDTHVELTYGRSASDWAFNIVTVLGVVGAVGWRVRGPRGRFALPR